MLALVAAPGILLTPAQLPAASPPELVKVERIWQRAPHNAFTDLIRFKEEWLCVFREGRAHVSPDGSLRVIASQEGERWTSAALLTSPKGDLRDPKISLTPAGELMLSGAVAFPATNAVKHQSLAWFSRDGRSWSEATPIGEPNLWLWRTTWHGTNAYTVAYDTAGERFVRLYTSSNGRRFDTLVPRLFEEGQPNETSLAFLPDETALCLLRRDGTPGTGQWGTARPPYTSWLWRDIGVKIGGPYLLRLEDGRLVAGVRLYDGAVRTSLAWVEPGSGKLTEFLKLPSSGDCSYPGLVWHGGFLWVSYYSSHEGNTSIYLAKVRLNR
jgi:hypothetical protein